MSIFSSLKDKNEISLKLKLHYLTIPGSSSKRQGRFLNPEHLTDLHQSFQALKQEGCVEVKIQVSLLVVGKVNWTAIAELLK